MGTDAMQRLVVIPMTMLIMVAGGVGTAAQDPLSVAKDLYASAAYEEALSALTSVREHSAPEVAYQVDQYIAFCLFALGRNLEAESAAELAIRKDPLAPFDPRDASPRIEAMFTLVRKRLLPGLIRDAYRTARVATEKGDLAGGAKPLMQVRRMLDAAKDFNVWDETLGDIDVLVEGFLQLSRVTAERRLSEAAPKAEPTPAAPAVLSAEVPAPPATVHQQATIPLRTYSALDTDVAPPVIVRQEIPTVPHSLASTMKTGKKSGVLEITIDETGTVEEAFMREPVNAGFDALVLEAARSWHYRPARKGGTPVRYVRRIRVAVGN